MDLARDYLRNHLVLATRDLDAARESVRAASVHAQLISPESRFFGLISNAQLRKRAYPTIGGRRSS
jgi:hypothetical protein